MKIILKKDVANLGDAGEVVEVKTGYALNYLVPQVQHRRRAGIGCGNPYKHTIGFQ